MKKTKVAIINVNAGGDYSSNDDYSIDSVYQTAINSEISKYSNIISVIKLEYRKTINTSYCKWKIESKYGIVYTEECSI